MRETTRTIKCVCGSGLVAVGPGVVHYTKDGTFLHYEGDGEGVFTVSHVRKDPLTRQVVCNRRTTFTVPPLVRVPAAALG